MTVDHKKNTNPVIIQESIPSRTNRMVIIVVLVIAFVLLSAYVSLGLRQSIGYSHFAYIPIIFAGFWWGRKALIVAGILGADVIIFGLISESGGPAWAYMIRAFSFMLVAFVIGELSAELIAAQKNLREREKRLRKTNASLRKFAKLRKDFLHIAIHDMKSPVAATDSLLHSLRTLLGNNITNRQEHLIERMHSRLEEAASFLKDFQLFAQLEDPTQVMKHATELDLNRIVLKVVDANRDSAAMKYQSLNTELAENLPPVGGVERLIQEVISNLVTNAIKYTPSGGHITVRTFVKNGVVSLEVEDDGIGISGKDQKKLFKEFVRIKNTEVDGKKVGGIGLGLSIVKRIVEMHGGRVYVKSLPGKGSIFGFELMVLAPGEGPLVKPARKLSSGETSAGE